MKTFCLTIVLGGLTTFGTTAQLLNKLKNAANQELNKLGSSQTSQPSGNKLSSNVTRTIGVTLQDDEDFDYGENCLDLNVSPGQLSFVVTKGRGNQAKCFSYKNGARTQIPCPTGNAPCQDQTLQCSYNKLIEVNTSGDEIKKYVTIQTQENSVTTPAISDQQMKAMAAYMTKEQLDQVKKQLAEAAKQTQNKTYSTPVSAAINFDGKQLGPFKAVTQFFLTRDSKNFYAVVTEDGNNGMVSYKVITSASMLTLSTGQMPPVRLLAAPDNSDFALVVLGMDGKYSLKTASEKSTPIDVVNLVDIWYSTTGSHIYKLGQSELYRDEQVIKTFPSGQRPDACNIYMTSDGQNMTIVKDNMISFADGDVYKYPLKIALVLSGGKTYFRWLALEDRQVVIYQKPN